MRTLVISCIVFALLAVVIQHAVKLAYYMGYFKHLYSHRPGHCSNVPGVTEGSEDIVLLSNDHVVFSSGLQFMKPDGAKGNGSLYIYDFLSYVKKPRKLDIDGLEVSHFEPHGLGHWLCPKTGRQYIYAVSHHPEVIIKFELVNNRALRVLQTFHSPDFMVNLNDVAVVGEDIFYFTNLFATSNPNTNYWDFVLFRHSSSIVLYKGGEYRYAVEKGHMMNGLAPSDDFRKIYVAAFFSLEVFDIAENYDLIPFKTVPLKASGDNVHVSSNGEVLIGAQPIMHECVAQLENPSGGFCSSQILRVSPDLERVTSFYANDGTMTNCSTIAVRRQNIMLIGTIQHSLTRCEVFDSHDDLQLP